MQMLDCEQGSAAWFQARAGIITASCMKEVLAKGQGKTRAAYMHKLIGEIMTGEPSESFCNQYTDRGHEQEPLARAAYTDTTGREVLEVGFIRNHEDIGGVGYSPDGLVGDDGSIEAKTRLPHLQVALLLSDKVPTEHVAQIQTGLWVSERKWCDFVSYCPSMPLFIRRVQRDEPYIETLKTEVTAFYKELREKMATIEKLITAPHEPDIIDQLVNGSLELREWRV